MNDAAGGASKFSTRSGSHDLKLFHGLEGDVDRRALTAELFAEEAVVVVAAVKTDVVEDAPLTGEIDLIAIRALCDADTWRHREQVFKLASEYWRCGHGVLVDGGANLRLHRVYRLSGSDGHRSFNTSWRERGFQFHRPAYSDHYVLVFGSAKALF